MLHCHAFMYHASLYMHCFDCFCIWSFFFFFCFSFVRVKIQNHIKSEKFKKFDRICLSTHHMWVLSYTFIQMALCIYELSLLCMYIYLCRKNLKIYVWMLWIDLQACHKWLVNSLDSFDTCVDLCLYIFPLFYFLLLLKELNQLRGHICSFL